MKLPEQQSPEIEQVNMSLLRQNRRFRLRQQTPAQEPRNSLDILEGCKLLVA
jgi:hypothetical protein